MDERPPARVSFPRGVWVAIAVVMLGQLAGILLQLGVVSDQRRLARDQKAIADRTLDELRPLIYETRDALPRARRTGRRVDALTREATPLTSDLRAADLPGVTRAVGALSRSLVEADSAASVRALRAMLGDMRQTSLVPRVSHAAALAPRQYEIQRRTFALQRQQLELARQTLAVARATLGHAESLDRKTGGPAAPAVPTVP
jgi:hypothetical protein